MIVEATGLRKTFASRKAPVEALRGIDLSVDEGEIVGLLGPNGAGKTTTIHVLTTLLRPDAGQVRIAGIDVLADPAAVRPLIGLTGQFAALDEQLTARENLVLFGRLFKLGTARAKERATQLLDQFDLADAADRRTVTFSGGMRRRLDLAASMIGDPKVLFLDEPTTGLDPRSRNTLWEIVQRLRDDGMTIILTTQYLAEADELADRIVVIDHGAVIAEGTPGKLKELVGGSVCEISVSGADHARVVRALESRWTVTHTPDTVSVPADGPATLFDVVRILDGHSVIPDDVGLRHPTLDDVFLALTGDVAGDGEPDRDDAESRR
ncbi:MAG: ATP-binding cassette domain-containing protein [Gordonia sp.]|nr:ATP-binding cassette domain-containing protein [Gordonia sp. (in: high G+C Gram-positive bacteria)]MCB1296108.1 ATP-binding cassette domain-containing protein [Gordonia sp. (in: high G+C Gram-positive bacteria)]HMS73817.1 ATP-binding cassette domain-containing protein [Gordonia sp. (in: high G+C Gram-positive bacteria)]HQV17701.1 ATP-binding cassette domain-containing protein [Gordonia sp. (in: high G+C Gram-positive bacteria)]